MRSNLARIFAVVMGVSLSLTILAACGAGTTTGSGTPTAGSTVIKIATDLPVSGKVIGGGKPIEDSVHLAVNEANANHIIPGYTLVFDPKDDVGPAGIPDPAGGAQNVSALAVDALVAGRVGPLYTKGAHAHPAPPTPTPPPQLDPPPTPPPTARNTPP